MARYTTSLNNSPADSNMVKTPQAGPFYDLAGATHHGGALTYVLLGYTFGLAGLFAESLLVNGLATLLLGHAMIIAAYLMHECGHNTVFRNNFANARLGRLLSHLCGASYGTFEDIRFKHFRHHVDNGDLVWFDYDAWFCAHPLLRRLTEWLERCYVPAHELIMHGVMAITSFAIPQRRNQRRHNLIVLGIRGTLFTLALFFAPKAALLYCLAYILMLIVLRFMDSVQHDYGGTLTLFDAAPGARKGDLAWEQAHTFSNPLSLRYEKLNWLVLNFGFHNAHHARPTVPWFRLPELHRQMFANARQPVINFGAQLKIYHRGRVTRVVKSDEGADAVYPVGPEFLEAANQASIPGGNAASFLTAF